MAENNQLPGVPYTVHDMERPQPPVVTPGEGGAIAAGAPSDATVLFDGSSLDAWTSVKNPGEAAGWKLVDGVVEVAPKTGDIQTKETFGSVQVHVEFQSPSEVKGESQGRGNSGIFLMGLYEVQVLDCFENPTYPDGTTGGIYGQKPPLANACRKPGEWQSFDIVFDAPAFDGETCVRPGYLTVFLNGVLLHNRQELLGPTKHKVTAEREVHPPEGPLRLQDHGDLVRFRNVWVRRLQGYDGGEFGA
jgi:hypothetical protein